MKVIFWPSILLIIYTYLLYPFIIFLAVSIKSSLAQIKLLFSETPMVGRPKSPRYFPMVSMVITAYNEERIIEQKINNCLEIDYPKDKFEAIIVSDGSTDKTNNIVRHYENSGIIKLITYKHRSGKTGVLNKTIPHAKGEIILLSDANTLYRRDAVRKLVRHFTDKAIGCVCGRLEIKRPHGSTSQDNLYWKYETLLKYLENKLGGVLGANGGIYAIRKELFTPIPNTTIIDDFVIPMKIKEIGYKVIYDHEAIATEETAIDNRAEFGRRIRIGAGNFQSIALTKKLLNPRRGFVAFSFWSHKIIRWLVPFFMIFTFISNLSIIMEVQSLATFYGFTFVLQIAFYTMALIGFLQEKRGCQLKLFLIPYVLVLMNGAFFLGFFKYFTKIQKVTWERTERTVT